MSDHLHPILTSFLLDEFLPIKCPMKNNYNYKPGVLPVRVHAEPLEEVNDEEKNIQNYPGKAGYFKQKTLETYAVMDLTMSSHAESHVVSLDTSNTRSTSTTIIPIALQKTKLEMNINIS